MSCFRENLKSGKPPLYQTIVIGLFFLGISFLWGCDSLTECNCEDEIDTLLTEMGTPSNFDIEESADYNRHEYIYDNGDGTEDTYVFEWGDEDPDGNTIDVCCSQSVTRGDEDDSDDEDSDDNSSPTADSISVSTEENTAVTFNVEDYIYDPDDDILIVSVDSQPEDGTATLESDEEITYTPDSGFTGTDTFTYEVCDPDGLCDSATVTVTVS